jgi:pre-rRNA-processing protein TSR4
MADYDSDSSVGEDIETGVTLGYATKDATGDDFSQLGGHPVSRPVSKDTNRWLITS